MRCRYCHNPDTWKMDGGDEVTADEILKRALRFKPYWGKDGGIMGRSGGKSIAPKHGAEVVRQRKFAAIFGIRRRGVIFSYFRNQQFRRAGNGEFAVRGRHEKRIAAAHDFIADFAFAAYARNGAETCGVGFQTFFSV